MRKLTVNIFVTMDNVIQAPGGPEEDTSGGFKFGGWSMRYWDDVMNGVMAREVMDKQMDLLLGRKTYDIFAAYWPLVRKGQDLPIAKLFNNATKYVVSKTMKKAAWKGTEIISGDVVAKIIALKKGFGPEIQVHGSANLIQTLLRNGLIDEMRIWTFPVTIGSGKRLFADGTLPSGWKLLESDVSTTGVIIAKYAPGGEIKIGSFELDRE